MITGSACHSGPFVTAILTVVMDQRNAKTTVDVKFFFVSIVFILQERELFYINDVIYTDSTVRDTD